MADKGDSWSRRTAIKTLAGGSLTLGVSGVVQAQESEREVVAENRSINLSKENALSQRELARKVQSLSDRYSPEVAASAVPGKIDPVTGELNDDVSSDQSPSNITNLDYLDSWEHSYKVKGGNDNHLLLTTDHFLSVYKSNKKDSQGRWHYFYWHWSQTETNNAWWHPQSSLKLMRNSLDIRSSSEEVTDFSPKNTSDINGRQKDIGVNVGFRGASFGMSSSVYVKDATFGPKTGEVDVGPSGKFSAELDANNTTGRQTLNATTVTRQSEDRESFYDCKWETHCEGKA